MKQYFSHIVLGLCMLLLGFSCQHDDPTDAFIEVSSNHIELGKEASSSSINVVTNQEHWEHLLPEALPWLTLEQNEDQLKYTLTENTSETARQATILLKAGDALQRIVIRQAGTMSNFSLNDSLLVFSSLGEEKTLNLGTSTQKTKLEILDDNAEWLSVHKIGNGIYSIRAAAQEENNYEARETKLILTIGNNAQEIKVRQEGQRYYMLPILKNPLTVQSLFAAEEARGSHVIRTIGGNNLNYFQFVPNARIGSAGFIEYHYSFMEDEIFTKASVVYKGKEQFSNENNEVNSDFLQFMQSEGFTPIRKDELSDMMLIRIPGDAYAYFAKRVDNTRYVAYLTNVNNNANTRLEIRHELVSLAPIVGTTFKRMPLLEQANWLGSKAFNKPALKKKADILTYEQNLGSQLDTENSGVLSATTGAYYSYFKTTPSLEHPETGRGYITMTAGRYWIPGVNITLKDDDPAIDDVEGVLASYDELGYIYGQQAGEYVVTAEARKLFADHGFPYARRMNDANETDLFLNTTTRLAYLVDRPMVNGKRKLRIKVQYFGN